MGKRTKTGRRAAFRRHTDRAEANAIVAHANRLTRVLLRSDVTAEALAARYIEIGTNMQTALESICDRGVARGGDRG